MFYVTIDIDHSFHFTTNASKSVQQIKQEIVADIRKKTDSLVFMFGWMQLMSTVFFVWMLYK